MIALPHPAWTEAAVANMKLWGDRVAAAAAVLAAGLPSFLHP
jgi:hypothetical protein